MWLSGQKYQIAQQDQGTLQGALHHLARFQKSIGSFWNFINKVKVRKNYLFFPYLNLYLHFIIIYLLVS